MSTFHPAPFNPPFWLSNPHLQSILPKFIAKKAPEYRRELVMDSFNESEVAYDYLDIDEPKNADGKYPSPIVVLFNGLEGSSDSHYARNLAYQANANGWHFVAPHYRGCGDIPVSGNVFYTAGDIDEMKHVLETIKEEYETIHVVGISMGGNMLAKYMGEYGDEALCQSAVVASAPVDLASSSIAMKRFMGKYIYTPYLLNPLVKKALSINLTEEELTAIKQSKQISDFDHAFTAPRHGYRSVNDYYAQASALPHLINITKPTLIITAKDDPFLGMTATKEDVSESVTLLDTKHGGHIGFMQYVAKADGLDKFDLTWLSSTSLAFFRAN